MLPVARVHTWRGRRPWSHQRIFVVAFVALVIGAGFAEISSSGAPTPAETAVVRWIIVAGVVLGLIAYVIGGRIREGRRL